MRTKPNDELRHEWRLSLEHMLGLARSTVAAKLRSLTQLEILNPKRSFLNLKPDDIVASKEKLQATMGAKTGKRLSYSTITHTLSDWGDFFHWLASTREGRRTLDPVIASWCRPSRADKERARASAPKPVPEISDAIAAFAQMPAITQLERRNRAVFATLLLTSIRADTLASLTLGIVDSEEGAIWQDARIVRTKFSKSNNVYFLPFAPTARPILSDWINELRRLGLGDSDALFPRDIELQRLADGERIPPGSWPCWSGSAQVRAIVRGAFQSAGIVSHAVV